MFKCLNNPKPQNIFYIYMSIQSPTFRIQHCIHENVTLESMVVQCYIDDCCCGVLSEIQYHNYKIWHGMFSDIFLYSLTEMKTTKPGTFQAKHICKILQKGFFSVYRQKREREKLLLWVLQKQLVSVTGYMSSNRTKQGQICSAKCCRFFQPQTVDMTKISVTSITIHCCYNPLKLNKLQS